MAIQVNMVSHPADATIYLDSSSCMNITKPVSNPRTMLWNLIKVAFTCPAHHLNPSQFIAFAMARCLSSHLFSLVFQQNRLLVSMLHVLLDELLFLNMFQGLCVRLIIKNLRFALLSYNKIQSVCIFLDSHGPDTS